MTPDRLHAITEELQREHTLASAAIATTRAALQEQEADISRIDAALLALSGSSATGTSRSPTTTRKKSGKQAPKKADVIQAMESILRQTEVVDTLSLQKQVEELLREENFSRTGLAMRFAEACRDPLFSLNSKGLSMSKRSGMQREMGERDDKRERREGTGKAVLTIDSNTNRPKGEILATREVSIVTSITGPSRSTLSPPDESDTAEAIR